MIIINIVIFVIVIIDTKHQDGDEDYHHWNYCEDDYYDYCDMIIITKPSTYSNTIPQLQSKLSA